MRKINDGSKWDGEKHCQLLIGFNINKDVKHKLRY